MNKKIKYTVCLYSLVISKYEPFSIPNRESLEELISKEMYADRDLPIEFDFDSEDEAMSKIEELKPRLYYYFDHGLYQSFDSELSNSPDSLYVEDIYYLSLNVITLKRKVISLDESIDEDELFDRFYADIPFGNPFSD